MARKSRKETAAVVVQEADATCRAAIYVRLSVEDIGIFELYLQRNFRHEFVNL